MKSIFWSVLVFTSIFTFTSCDVTDNYALSAKVNNQTWLSEKGVAAAQGTNVIVLNALNNSKPAIALTIRETEVGEHLLDSINNGFLYAFQGDLIGGFYATTSRPGRLTILEHDATEKFIKGMFDVVAINYLNGDSVTVSEGKFSVYYQ